MEEEKIEQTEELLSPKAYFDNIKGLKHQSTKEDLEKYVAVQNTLMKKAIITGQKEQLRKLQFISECLQKEALLIDQGITTFVYKEDILAYADKITDKSIKITELENFPREIPDEVVEQIGKLKELKIFDEFFIVYTDYTEVEPALREKIKKERDPILFGTFLDRVHGVKMLHSRFYYIADWVDDYCDLTLSKMVETMAKAGKNITYELSIPVTEEQLSAELNSLVSTTNKEDVEFRIIHARKKPSFFQRVSGFFKKKK